MLIQRILLILLVLFCSAAYAETASAANATTSYLIVVQSTPAYLFEKGQIIAGEPTNLFAGQSVKLIAGDGSVFTLKGTYSGVPTRHPDKSDAPELVLEKALASLSEVPYIIVRAAESQPPSVWMVNVESQGKYCAPSRTIELWRENANRRQTLYITPRRGKRQKRKWPAKKHVYAFTFQEGVTYTINLARHLTRNFTFYQVPAGIRFTPRRVTWMAKTGCVSQAKRLFPW